MQQTTDAQHRLGNNRISEYEGMQAGQSVGVSSNVLPANEHLPSPLSAFGPSPNSPVSHPSAATAAPSHAATAPTYAASPEQAAEVDVESVIQLIRANKTPGEFHLVTTEEGIMEVLTLGDDLGALTTEICSRIGQDLTAYVIFGRRWLISKPPDRYLLTPFGKLPLRSPARKKPPADEGAYLADEPVQLPAPTVEDISAATATRAFGRFARFAPVPNGAGPPIPPSAPQVTPAPENTALPDVNLAYVTKLMQERQEPGTFFLFLQREYGRSKLQEFGQDVAALVAAVSKLLGKSVTVSIFYGQRWPITKPPDRHLITPYGVRIPLRSAANAKTADEEAAYLGDVPTPAEFRRMFRSDRTKQQKASDEAKWNGSING